MNITGHYFESHYVRVVSISRSSFSRKMLNIAISNNTKVKLRSLRLADKSYVVEILTHSFRLGLI